MPESKRDDSKPDYSNLSPEEIAKLVQWKKQYAEEAELEKGFTNELLAVGFSNIEATRLASIKVRALRNTAQSSELPKQPTIAEPTPAQAPPHPESVRPKPPELLTPTQASNRFLDRLRRGERQVGFIIRIHKFSPLIIGASMFLQEPERFGIIPAVVTAGVLYAINRKFFPIESFQKTGS